MKKYNIKVNGKLYEVEVELAGTDSAPEVRTEPKAAPAPKPAAPKGTEGAIKVRSPMPGTIFKVNTKAGDTVAKGQALCILEAMKMENEISAPQDGTVASVNVSEGTAVESGTVLVTLN